MKLTKKKIKNAFQLLNEELKKNNSKGELYVVGGAVMCLVFDARPSTMDVDALFKPTSDIRRAAARVGEKLNIGPNWLNDGVKGFLSKKNDFQNYLELENLKIFTATSEYMLAMKCLAMRLGEEFHDLDDIRYLIRNIGISSYKDACEIIVKYYPLKNFPQKTLYALQELFD